MLRHLERSTWPEAADSWPLSPRDAIAIFEARPQISSGTGERFAGYALPAVRFKSGDVLALRRYTACQNGQPYTSVWHRTPEGTWTLFQDAPDRCGCAKYVSSAMSRIVRAPIHVVWTGADRFTVLVESRVAIKWHIRVKSSASTRLLSRLATRFGSALGRHRLLARLVGIAAGLLLQSGPLPLATTTPNNFQSALLPKQMWLVSASRAWIGGVDAGEFTPSWWRVRFARLRLPDRGVLALVETTLQKKG